jgi:hypothetical protein
MDQPSSENSKSIEEINHLFKQLSYDYLESHLEQIYKQFL